MGEDILRQAEPQALLVGYWNTIPVVQYLQLVEGQRPDVLALNRFLIAPADLETLLREKAGQRPVYVENPPEDLQAQAGGLLAGKFVRLIGAPK